MSEKLVVSTQQAAAFLTSSQELRLRKSDKISVSVEVTFQVEENFSVKNGRELFVKSGPDANKEICWTKIGSLWAELWACKVRTNLARVARERIELNFKHAQLLSYWSDFASTYLIFSAWSLLREKSSTLSVLSLTVWPEIDLNWLSVWVWEWCPSMLILFSFSLRAPLQLSQIWLCRSCELFWHALRISNWSEVSFWYP